MGARPSSFKTGGGYLNNIDATITGFSFLRGETKIATKGKNIGQPFTPLSLVPSFRADGADVDQTQRLLIGDATWFGDISEDGKTLSTPEGQNIGANTEAGMFISSLVKPLDGGKGFPEENFSDSDTEISFSPAVGTRVSLTQVVNVEKTKNQGQQVGKDGKKYDRKDLKVKSVLAVGAGEAVKGAKASAKPAAGKKAAVAAEADIDSLSAEVLVAVLNDAKVCPEGSISRLKLPVHVAKKSATSPHKDAIRPRVFSVEFLALERGWAYDADSETIVLV